jgi:Alpha-2,8-polysialyltransferase (POLYST)
MNFYIVGSPWHLLVACSIDNIDGNGVFVLEEVSESSIRTMVSICNKLKLDYYKIGSIRKTRFSSARLFSFVSFVHDLKEEIHRVKVKFIQLLGEYRPKTIFYFNFYSPITRVQLAESGDVDLVRVEDGVCDYFDFPFVHYSIAKREVKNILCRVIFVHGFFSRKSSCLERRTSEYKLFFPDKKKKWSGKKTSLMYIKDNLKEIISCLNLLRFSYDINNGSVLIIGQTLYEDNILSLSEEIDLYKRVLDKYNNIVFKPHPRSSEKKIRELKNIGKGFQVIDEACVVEELMVLYGFRSIVGMWSNPIIYGPSLFGIRTYSLLNDIDSNDVHVLRIKSALINLFPDLFLK